MQHSSAIHLVTVIGARPQFVKAATVRRAAARSGRIDEIMVHTGQHYDANMSDVFFVELSIPAPKHHLGIGGGTHGENTGRMLVALERVIRDEHPTAVLVYGDTDSTLAGALAAAKLHVPVVHIEAGLRSFNMRMPEEINRRLTDHVSDLLLTPNQHAVTNLAAEGIVGGKVRNVGDVMFDAAVDFGRRASATSTILERIDVGQGDYVLATIHRQETTDCPERLARVLNCLSQAIYPVILPLHPRTRQRLASYGLQLPPNVTAIEPVGYLDMVMLEKYARLIATDSGGVQKEAYFHGVPCVTLRAETEWLELVEMGWNRLADPDAPGFEQALAREYPPGDRSGAPYGAGNAAELAVDAILDMFG